MPSANATQSWVGEASFAAPNGTVWMMGYIRTPITATFTFQLATPNVQSILYLSADENPDNITAIANSNSNQSGEIILRNNTK
jgi:hypothetical protein